MDPLPASLFRENRRRLSAALPQGALAVITTGRTRLTTGPDSAGPWPDFFWLTGRREPDCALLLHASRDGQGRTIFFSPGDEARRALWDGPSPDPDSFPEVRSITEFDTTLRAMAWQSSALFVFSPENPFVPDDDHSLAERCRRLLPLHPMDRLAPVIGRLRADKQTAEQNALRTAGALAAAGFRRAVGFVRPGVRGFEIRAEFLHEITRQGSAGLCCPAITAAGPETLTLHWRGDRRAWAAGEVALLDFTTDWNGLCADAARTVPVGGRFTPRQKAIAAAVARVHRSALAGLRPGRPLSACQREVELALQDELLRLRILSSADVRDASAPCPALRKHFMHQAFHHTGMEVHDPVPSSVPLAAGHTVAVEPALYLPEEGFGVRIEDTVLITADAPEILTAPLPVEPDEIEALMEA